jgi:hypothetical protein
VDISTTQFASFLHNLPSEFGYLPLLFSIPGLVFLFRRNRKILVFSLLLFLGCLGFALNYDVHDVTFFLIAYVAMAVWIACGIHALMQSAKNRSMRRAIGAACLATTLLPLGLHYNKVDESGDYSVEDYARNVLAPLEPNAVILAKELEFVTFPAYYLQLVEGVRPDVVVIDESLLMLASYYAQLERRYPWLIRESRSEVEAMLRDIEAFDNKTSSDPSGAFLTARSREMGRLFIMRSYATHPVYVSSVINPEIAPGFHGIPVGLTFRLFKGDPGPPAPAQDFSFRTIPRNNPQLEQVTGVYAAAYANQGVYRASIGETTTGIAFLRKALTVRPGFPVAMTWLSRLGQ